MADVVPVLLSAPDAAALRQRAARLHDALARPDAPTSFGVGDVAARCALVPPGPHRAVVLAADLPTLLAGLRAVRDDTVSPDASPTTHAVAVRRVTGPGRALLLYPGQGSQRTGEHAALARLLPTYAAHVRRLEDRLAERLDGPPLRPHLSDAWASGVTDPGVDDTAVAQPLLTVTALATTAALAEIGVLPAVTLGHSVGELGALHAAGLLDEDTVLDVVAARVACMRTGAPDTGMLAVRAGLDALAPLVAQSPGVHVACDNGPRQVVLGGPLTALCALAARLEAAGTASTPLATAGAFHTPHYAHADRAMRSRLAALRRPAARATGATCVSSVTGAAVGDVEQAFAGLGRQIAGTVRFREAVRTAVALPHDVVVQVSGGGSLLRTFHEIDPDRAARAVGLGGPDSSTSTALAALAELVLTVPDVRAHVVLGRLGTASRCPRTDEGRETVVLHGTPTTPTTDDPAPLAPAADHPLAADRRPGPAPVPGSPLGVPGGTELLALFGAQVAVLAQALARPQGGAPADVVLPAAPVTAALAPPTPAPAALVPGPRPAPEPVTPALSPARVADEVRACVAEIGGYAPDDVRGDARLGTDLGLDSLMMTTVAARLTRDHPAWRPTAEDMRTLLTVDDVARAVVDAERGPAPADPAGPTAPAPAATAPAASPRTAASGDDAAPTPRGGTVTAAAPPPAAAAPPVPDRGRLTELPEVRATTARLADAATGGGLPYYLPHDGRISATTSVGGRELVSFSSYNYLGLTGHPRVVAAAQEAVERYGTSVSAARILSGHRPLHDDLEHAIAGLLGTQDAVVLVGGHATNAGVVPHLYGPDDLVVHDALVHDSVQQGIAASGAARHAVPHGRADLVEEALRARRHRFRRVLVVTEGVFSMDGDLPDLPALVASARRHGAHLMVDEAHSVGVLGAHGGGVCEELGVDPADVDILMGTLSKSLSSCGGYLAGHRDLVQHLRYTLSALVFSAGLTPANTAASLAAIQVMRDEPERLARLRANAQHFLAGARARGLDVGPAVGVPVVPVVVGDSAAAVEVARRLAEEGVSANPIVFPAVPDAQARLRFFLTSEHTAEQLDHALDATARSLAAAGVRTSERVPV
ncbi:aminotransferase class I/II-fold pyridoxal phosphate-dependent enzyme [Cellulomonas iranensis]|uniref:aminotransferase class I/II-fold pyridoxal phosphate-dependent enzyme n=1 Tax=Cellulomonas iranensis TaxID=76862 RepID=UPI001CF2C562|nr:aminotransferase class I/II-fold pyridoxal phosphate-dependent enzyme [Cellulomonas iranensis]UCN13440.1 aminotransferase class I/II-fold pyridoxal phosphate-dependent enzyme [Cellulomonas iranensis]